MPILVFLGLSVLDLVPMYAIDRRQTDVRRASSLNAPTLGALSDDAPTLGAGIKRASYMQIDRASAFVVQKFVPETRRDPETYASSSLDVLLVLPCRVSSL